MLTYCFNVTMKIPKTYDSNTILLSESIVIIYFIGFFSFFFNNLYFEQNGKIAHLLYFTVNRKAQFIKKLNQNIFYRHSSCRRKKIDFKTEKIKFANFIKISDSCKRL